MEVSSSTSRVSQASQLDNSETVTSAFSSTSATLLTRSAVSASTSHEEADSLNNALSSEVSAVTLEPVRYGSALPSSFCPTDSDHYSKDVKDSKALAGSCGLYNLGNTCFMNSGLQSLLGCSPLVKFFCETYTVTESNRHSLTTQFYLLLCKVWNGQYSVVHPRTFKDSLGFFHTQFQDYRQHDCQEFLALLLDTLQEQLNTATSNEACSASFYTHPVAGTSCSPPLAIPLPFPGTRSSMSNICSAICAPVSAGQERSGQDCDRLNVKIIVHNGEAVASYEHQSTETVFGGKSYPPSDSSVISVSQEIKPETTIYASSERISDKYLEMAGPVGELVGPSRSEGSPISEISLVDSLATSPSSYGYTASHKSPDHGEEEDISSKFPPLRRFLSRSNLDDVTSSDSSGTMVKPSLKRISNRNSVTASGLVFTSEDSNHSTLSAHSTDSEQSSAFKRLKIDSHIVLNRSANNNMKDCVSSSSDCKKGNHRSKTFFVDREVKRDSGQDSFVSSNVSTSSPDGPKVIDNIVSSLTDDVPGEEIKSILRPCDRTETQSIAGFATALPCLEDFYSKETKTLNTNMLVSDFLHEITSDSEKFAKVDNKSCPLSKEVNVLQEAVSEEDKAEKVLISQQFGVKNTNLHSQHTSAASFVVKSTKISDPNVFHKSFSHNEVNLISGGQVSKFSQLASQEELRKVSGTEELKSSAASGLAQSNKLDEEDKNVQMQPYSKFNTIPVRSNIRTHLTDKVHDAMDVDEVEGESSDEDEVEPASHTSTVEECSSVPNCLRHCALSEVAMANESWQEYLCRNTSIVVSTFQGQFRSTVVCSECGHVSVTYEPFMYLSLPIPHAMEQQIAVTYIAQHGRPVRYLLNMMKTDKIGTVKKKLKELLGMEDGEITIAEVLDCRISRILDDNILLKYVNSLNRKIYAFEILYVDSCLMDVVESTPCINQLLNNEESTPLQYDRDFPTSSREELPLLTDSQRSSQSFDSVNVNSPSSRDTVDFSDPEGGFDSAPQAYPVFSYFGAGDGDDDDQVDVECQSTSDEPGLRDLWSLGNVQDGETRRVSSPQEVTNEQGCCEDTVYDNGGGSPNAAIAMSSSPGADDNVSSCTIPGFWTDHCEDKFHPVPHSSPSFSYLMDQNEAVTSGMGVESSGSPTARPHCQKDKNISTQKDASNIPEMLSLEDQDLNNTLPASEMSCFSTSTCTSSVSPAVMCHIREPVPSSAEVEVAGCGGSRSRSCPSPEAFPASQNESGTLMDVAARLEDTDAPGAFFLQHSPAQRDFHFYQDEEGAHKLVSQHSSSCTSKADQCELGTNTWETSRIQNNAGPSQPEKAMCPDANSSIVMEWRSCAICLEDLLDSEILTHIMCDGVFCQNCLQMSVKHTADVSAFCCPICLQPASVYDDFIALATASTAKPKIRTLPMCIAYRQLVQDNTGTASFQLYGHPNLLHTPSVVSGESLFSMIDRMMTSLCGHLVSPPTLVPYTILLTDGQGMNCSRCLYSCHCTGCKVLREGEVTLQASDCLTVQPYETLQGEQLQELQAVHDDLSMEGLRSSQPTTIMDCFGAFTQSELLDEHNPWYCPQCERNQGAKKTMTVWRYPDNLIIHLKRFVYQDLASTKVDTKVIFPQSDMDVRGFLSGPSSTSLVYDLHSIVCHFGSANAGHYTCYARHPLRSQWYYYNDETVTQQIPSDGEFSSGYMLFYQRQGTEVEFSLPQNLSVLDEDVVEHPIASATSAAASSSHQSNNTTTVTVSNTTTALMLYQPPSHVATSTTSHLGSFAVMMEDEDDDYDNERRSLLFDEDVLTIHFGVGFPEDPENEAASEVGDIQHEVQGHEGQADPDSTLDFYS